MQSLSVTTPHGSYPVHLGCGAVGVLPELIRSGGYDAVWVLVDEHTRSLCWPRLSFLGLSEDQVLEIPSGERHKTLETCRALWSAMLRGRATRNALLINLGGGVIGDLGGFVAATFKRGIDFVQVPTTLLAQVDASIGGKVGVDYEGVKNTLGVFAPPVAVVADPVFLETLPYRELRAGFAEMLKHALIADAAQWERLAQLPADLSGVDWAELLLPSLRIKQGFVEADPWEKNIRRALNFGHTLGHALESWSLADRERPLLHGEAVALGMIGETGLSVAHAGLAPSAAEHIREVVERFFPLVGEGLFPPVGPGMETLLPYLWQDKKNRADLIGWVLLENIGQYRMVYLPPDPGRK
jgi:3-dehydroquinate synthase